MVSSTTSGGRTDALTAQLRDAILRGDYPAGSRLPAERDLAPSLGVGRSTVREAVAKLAQLGLVEVRHGGGATVMPVVDANLEVLRHLLVLDGKIDLKLVGEFLDMMELLLMAMVRFSIERASDAEIEHARELLDKMGEPGAGDAEFLDALEELVQLMAEASRHTVLRLVRNGFRAIIGGDAGRRPRGRIRPREEDVEAAIKELHTALDQRDAEAAVHGARQLMRAGREQFMRRQSQRAR